MGRLHALNPEQPTALWVLGADAAARGDKQAARGFWQPLLDRIPEGTAAHQALRNQLEALGE